jgi:hypothetical protein
VGGDRIDRQQDRLHGQPLRKWVRQGERPPSWRDLHGGHLQTPDQPGDRHANDWFRLSLLDTCPRPSTTLRVPPGLGEVSASWVGKPRAMSLCRDAARRPQQFGDSARHVDAVRVGATVTKPRGTDWTARFWWRCAASKRAAASAGQPSSSGRHLRQRINPPMRHRRPMLVMAWAGVSAATACADEARRTTTDGAFLRGRATDSAEARTDRAHATAFAGRIRRAPPASRLSRPCAA